MLWHIGRLDPGLRGARGESQEGHCLSVSTDPLAWRRIARLGGEPLWRFEGRAQVTFVDLLELCRRQPAVIAEWGVAQGLLRLETVWRAAVPMGDDYDDDGAWGYTLHATEDEAWGEAPDWVDPEDLPAGVVLVERAEIWAPTETLRVQCELADRDVREGLQMAALCWIDHHVPEALGAWWSEIYAPSALSAPRGGILPSRQARCAWVRARWEDASDASAGCRLPWSASDAGATLRAESGGGLRLPGL